MTRLRLRAVKSHDMIKVTPLGNWQNSNSVLIPGPVLSMIHLSVICTLSGSTHMHMLAPWHTHTENNRHNHTQSSCEARRPSDYEHGF